MTTQICRRCGGILDALEQYPEHVPADHGFCNDCLNLRLIDRKVKDIREGTWDAAQHGRTRVVLKSPPLSGLAPQVRVHWARRRGDNEATNLITACRSCNSSRQDRPWVDYATGGARDRIETLRVQSLNLELAKALIADKAGDDALETR